MQLHLIRILFITVALTIPIPAIAAGPMSLAGLTLNMTPAQVTEKAQELGYTQDSMQGQDENTTLYSYHAEVYGARPLTFSCFYHQGRLSDIIIDFSPDTKEEISHLKNQIAEQKSEWDMLFGDNKNIFKMHTEDGLNKMTWDLDGQKAGIFYDDSYNTVTFFVRKKLGTKEQ